MGNGNGDFVTEVLLVFSTVFVGPTCHFEHHDLAMLLGAAW